MRGVLFQGLLNQKPQVINWLIQVIVNLILMILTIILDSPDSLQQLHDIHERLSHLSSKTNCLATEPTVAKNAAHHTEASLIDRAIQSAITLLKKYQHLKGFPKKLILIIDSNCKEYWGKFKNRLTGWMKKAQTDLWMRSKNREGFYFGNVPIFICEAIMKISKKPRTKKAVPEWIQICSKILVALEEAGFVVDVILADRGYFEAVGFAYAGLNAWNHGKGLKHPPKLMTPQQFSGKYAGKRDFKWTWLLHLRLSSIQEYQMKFHYQDRHLILDIEHNLLRTASRDGYLVRTIRVISFDLNKKQHAKTREWAHQEALKIEDQLKSGQKTVEEKVKLFKKEYERVQKKTLKRNPTFPKGGPQQRKYKNEDLEQAYQALRKATETLNRVKAAKTKLINRVFVTIISIDPKKSLRSVRTSYLALPQLYVLRWRIENAFKALKSDFYIPCASNRSIQVLYFRTVAITLLNEYSYSRVLHYQYALHQNPVPGSRLLQALAGS